MNYLMIIIDGIALNREFLPDYFYREFIKAEKLHIGWNEFHSNLKRVLVSLRTETEQPYYDQLTLWNKYVIQQKDRGLEVDMKLPEKFDSGIPLFILTDGKYRGHLFGTDIDYIENSLSESYERLLREKGLFPLFYYAFEKNITPSDTALMDPLKLQKVFELAQRVNDLTFIKELNKLEANQISEYLDFHLRVYLRNNGSLSRWIEHTKSKVKVYNLTQLQSDVLFSWFEEKEKLLGDNTGSMEIDINDPINNILNCLSGYWMKSKIMTKEEFSRLVEYARYTIEYGKLPQKINPISKGNSGLSKLFYQHTIYRLWVHVGKPKGQKQLLWIKFVKKTFKDHYSNTAHDITKSFSRYGKGKVGYDMDKDLITY